MPYDRNTVFDYAKGIGILLVVYGHVARGVFNAGLPLDPGFYRLVDAIIYSFHMPLFFFLAGLFFLQTLEKRGYPGMLRNKLGTVFYPYLLWSLIQGGVEVVLAAHTNGGATASEVLALLWQPRAQFWFLYVLFGIFLVGGLLYRYRARAWNLGVLTLALVLHLTAYSPVDIYLLNAFSHWFVYFALGVSAAAMSPWPAHRGWTVLAVAILVFGLAHWTAQAAPAAYTLPGISLLLSLPGILLVLALSRQLAALRWDWLGWIGRHSLEIYLIHILASSGTRIILEQQLGLQEPVLHLALGTLAGVLASLVVAVLARRWGLGWLFQVTDSGAKQR